jgi:hypothetical protein
MFRAFGFSETDNKPIIIGLLLFSSIVAPIEHLIGLAQQVCVCVCVCVYVCVRACVCVCVCVSHTSHNPA